jgi:hypothetical protein
MTGMLISSVLETQSVPQYCHLRRPVLDTGLGFFERRSLERSQGPHQVRADELL